MRPIRTVAIELEPGDYLPGSRTMILRRGRLIDQKPGRARWVVKRRSGKVEEVDWNARTRMGVFRP